MWQSQGLFKRKAVGEFDRRASRVFSSVNSVAQSCPTLRGPMNCSTPGLRVHHQLLEFTQTHIHWIGDPSNHLILCLPFLLLPSIGPSIRVFSNESALCIRWPKYWSFSFSISTSNEYSGLIYFSSQTQFLAWRDKQEYLYLFNTNHYWKRLWCWEGLGAGGEEDDRWDGWMASLTQWTWVSENSRSWWWTRRPGVLQFMGLQRVGHDWATELNWTSNNVPTSMLVTELKCYFPGHKIWPYS